MSTLVTILSTDLITNSRADINANFAALNADKIETSYLDTDTTLAANSDSKIPTQKAVKAYVDAGGNVNATTTTRGIVEQATAAEISARTTTGSTGAPLFINPGDIGSILKFGGTGADGALSISSGTTTIDLANAAVVIKNYTSISITGTAKLNFSNPATNGTIIILRSQGNVTLTSSTAPCIDASGMGAAGGAGRTSNGTGATGNSAYGFPIFATNAGSGGTVAPAGGTGGALPTAISPATQVINSITNLYDFVIPGAGGGAGAFNGGAGTSGAGGNGGGGLILECAGALNITGTISTAGLAGSTGSGTNEKGGGGGGAAGVMVILYNTLTANSGTFTVAGGNGGNNSAGSTGIGGGAGAGSSTNAGTNGTTGGANANTGGPGAASFSLVAVNTSRP